MGSKGAAGPTWKRSSANPRPLRAHGRCAAAGGLLGPLNICGRRGACGHQGGDGGLTELSGGDRISPGNQRWLNRRPCQSLLTGESALRDRTTVCVDRERQRQRSPCDHLAPCVGGGVMRQPARTGRHWTRPPSPGPRDQPRRAPPAPRLGGDVLAPGLGSGPWLLLSARARVSGSPFPEDVQQEGGRPVREPLRRPARPLPVEGCPGVRTEGNVAPGARGGPAVDCCRCGAPGACSCSRARLHAAHRPRLPAALAWFKLTLTPRVTVLSGGLARATASSATCGSRTVWPNPGHRTGRPGLTAPARPRRCPFGRSGPARGRWWPKHAQCPRLAVAARVWDGRVLSEQLSLGWGVPGCAVRGEARQGCLCRFQRGQRSLQGRSPPVRTLTPAWLECHTALAVTEQPPVASATVRGRFSNLGTLLLLL